MTTAVNPPPTNLIKPNTTLTGRTEYLKWINESLKMDLNKIEELCAGTVYCQFMHVLFPNSILLRRVRWSAITEPQFIDNFKVLQKAFVELKVKKIIPLEKLVKGNFMENYDFLVWFKVFYDANFQEWPTSYDAKEERVKAIAARSSSTAPSRTPDTLHAPRCASNIETGSPSGGTIISQDSGQRSKLIEAQLLIKDLQIENVKIKKERDLLKGDLDMSIRDLERVRFLLGSVKDYCIENSDKEAETLKIILAICNQPLEESSTQADYHYDETLEEYKTN